MTGEMRSLIWQTIGFLQGISGEIPQADDYATRLTEQMAEHDLNALYCDSLTSGTVTLKAAPTTYTCGDGTPCIKEKCAKYPYCERLPLKAGIEDECEACEVKL